MPPARGARVAYSGRDMTATPQTLPDDACALGLYAPVSRWFAAHARDLPWRAETRTPWEVMVSEFMLQQTPVVRVLPVWQEWMRRWPRPEDLAAEPAGEAVRAWGRLGYPRRALRLHAAASAITERHGGQVPEDHAALLDLPGVGAYTAAAIAVFAFGQRHPVVDTNIRRVHARAVSGKGLPGRSLTAAESRLAERLLPEDPQRSVRWNIAVMELGALVCTARSPRCEACPLRDRCAWLAAGRPEPDYQPKGQAWKGTDRQARGAIMAVLRAASGPVPRALILDPGLPGAAPEASGGGEPGGGVVQAVAALRRLEAPREQLERCVAGLLADGLAAAPAPDTLALP